MPILHKAPLTKAQKTMLIRVLTEEKKSGKFRSEANDEFDILIYTAENPNMLTVTRGHVLKALNVINAESYVRAKVQAGYVTARFSREAIGILQNILDIPLQAIERDVPTVSLRDMFQSGMAIGGMFMMSPALVPEAKVNAPLAKPITNVAATTFTEKNSPVKITEDDMEDFANEDNPFVQGYLQNRS